MQHVRPCNCFHVFFGILIIIFAKKCQNAVVVLHFDIYFSSVNFHKENVKFSEIIIQALISSRSSKAYPTTTQLGVHIRDFPFVFPFIVYITHIHTNSHTYIHTKSHC